MAFSLGQFLGAPIIGEYADRHGRKKALGVSVFFTLVGLSLSAWSMQIGQLYVLFVGRLITGIFASSTSVCLSCITDLSENETAKVKNFGYLSMIAGMAFVLGAFVGGKLADKTLNSSFSANTPLWLAAAITLVNFFFVLFGFRETSPIHRSAKFRFFEAFHRIQIALQTERIKTVYILYFLFLFAWAILFQFFPVLTVEKFAFTSSNIGDLALFMGACWAFGSGYLNKILIHRFRSPHILEVCLIGFTLFSALVIFPNHIYSVLVVLGFCVIFGGLAWPICTGLISSMAPPEMQGKILGVSQSTQSLAMTLGPVIGGMAFHLSLQFPFLIVAATNCVAVILYYFVLKRLKAS